MKKLTIILTIFITLIPSVGAKTVKYSKCVDGDTVHLIIDNEDKKVRMLAVDAPEIAKDKTPADAYGNEARDYVCTQLKDAEKLEIEYDPKSKKEDKYGRDLLWIFVDGELLQGKLVKEGLAKVAYLYGDYKYTGELQKLEKEAKEQKLKIWSNVKEEKKEDNKLYIYIGIIILLLLLIFSKKFRRYFTNGLLRKVANRASDKILKKE